jgi:hypothetical protein
MTIKRLKDAKKPRILTLDKKNLAFKDHYKNNDPNIPYNEKKCYKTFKDLNFKAAAHDFGLIRAGLEFENGYGVSVVVECETIESLYEIAVLKNGSLCYDSGITEDVFRNQNKKEIDNIMKDIQRLKSCLK